jgi:type IV secretion system protein VirB4
MAAALSSKRKKSDASSKDLESFKDISDDVIESDFVPYACLYDPSTVVTKDGELLQTIKITGMGYDAHAEGNLRTAIRRAIKQSIPSDAYAIWLHTLRRKQPGAARTHFPDSFSGKLDEAWRAQQPSATTYSNELYLTLVRASSDVALKNKKLLLQSIFPQRDIAQHEEELQSSLKEITATSDAMLARLAAFGARRLTMVERDGIFYHEQLEFLEKLINLEERPMPMPERDLSHVLTSGEITFGFNAMEVRTATGVRRFAAILTVKDYKEATLAGIDKFLAIPCELIVSQCFDFTGAAQAQESYEKQARYLRYSGDNELAKWMEMDRLMESQAEDARMAYGQQQTTIFLISPGVNQLESNVRMVQRALNRLGIIVVREDLRFEECYWSQLPANFPFITRKQAVDTDHLAGFVNLQAAPMGNAVGSPWGAPITLFHSAQDAPYYFNFHRQANAHTILLGSPTHSATSMAHFLLAQTRKLPVAIWYLDGRGRAAPFLNAMGASALQPGTPQCKLNPLQLPATPENREFIAMWLATLIDPSGRQLTKTMVGFLQTVVDQVLALPPVNRRMANVIALLRDADAVLAATVQPYAQGGAYGELFDMPEDTFTTASLAAWDISRYMADPATRVPLTGYLMHRLTAAINNQPTLIVLSDAFALFNTPLMSTRVGGWCDYLSQKNAAAMLLSDDVEASATYGFTGALAARAANLIALPTREAGAGYGMGYGMSAADVSTLHYLTSQPPSVLLKRGDEAVVLRAPLDALPADLLQPLSGKVPAREASPADTLAALMGYGQQAVV